MRKGTYRTALEWAKLLFSLDPADPYGMNHLIHILAIKCHESEWLRSFLDTFEPSNLHGEMRYYRNTLVLGLQQRQEDAEAKRRLIEGMEDVPWLFCALFQALNIDAPPQIWGVQPPSEVDVFYTKLYVQMAKDLWNHPRATSLLKDAANSAKKQESLKATDALLELRTARFVYLEGSTEMLSLVPRHYLERQPNYDFDPLPPDVSENIFASPTSGVALPFTSPALNPAERQARLLMELMQGRNGGAAGAGAGAGVGGMPGGMDEMGVDEVMAQALGLENLDDLDLDEDDELEDDDATIGAEDLNQPSVQESIYNRLLQLFGGRRDVAGRAGERQGEGDGDRNAGATATTSASGGLPGAWPVDEDDEVGGGDRQGGDRRADEQAG